jgi:translation initiation factor IF-2
VVGGRRAGGPAPSEYRDGGGGRGKRRRVVIDAQASRRGPGPQGRDRRGQKASRTEEREPAPTIAPADMPQVDIRSGATVKEMAEALGITATRIITTLMGMGEMATITQSLSDEEIELVAAELERKIQIVHAEEEDEFAEIAEDTPESLAPRAPVVTVMGHVDHGKTSLLDAIRETEVVAGEAGGITQHIGAYQVHHHNRELTFLDTPGHEAFTAMRARGAKITDVAVIVVAADDGVMPQTKEAIDHARAAEVPILIAVNKIDKEGAQPDRVRNELASDGLTPEDWGGETVYCDVSAKTHEGLDNLLDMILLVAELEELGANPDAPASGTVIESQLDPGRGPVVSILVQRGTLRVGDSLVAGPQWGRVRAMQDFMGDRLDRAVPGMPVEVLGFDGVCEAGEMVRAVENDRRARQLAQERANRLKTEALARRQARKVSLEEVFSRAQEGEIKELDIVLKADVAGSLEALQDEIAKVPQEQVGINVIHSQTGGINESDVMLATASEAIIIGFNVRPLADARRAAEREGVDIRTYSVIYKVTEDLRNAMEGMLEAVEVEETLGEAEIKQTFKASKVGRIAGCLVTEGRVARDAGVRLIREGTVIWEGRLGSLRRFKDNVQEVEEGQECGIVLDGYADVKEGDVLEFFRTKQVEQTLE